MSKQAFLAAMALIVSFPANADVTLETVSDVHIQDASIRDDNDKIGRAHV